MVSRVDQRFVFTKTMKAVVDIFYLNGIAITVHLDDHRDRVVLDTDAFFPVEFLKTDGGWEVGDPQESETPRIATEIMFDPDPETTVTLFLKVLAAIFWPAAPMGSADGAASMDDRVFLPAERYLEWLSDTYDIPEGNPGKSQEAAEALQVIGEGRDNYHAVIAALPPSQ